MRTLWPHQQEAVDAYFKGVRLIGFDVGLGKTLVPLEIMRLLWEGGERVKTLVLCPTNAMYTWHDEMDHFDFTRYIYQKPGPQIGTDINVMTYERFRSTNFDWNRYQMVIFDELHKVKNPRAKVTKKVVKMLKDVPIKIGLGGTTIVKYHEIYAQVEALQSGYWKKFGISTYTDFKQRYFVCHPTNFYPMYVRQECKDLIMQMVSPIMITKNREDTGMGRQEIEQDFEIKGLPKKKDIMDLGDFQRTLVKAGGYDPLKKEFFNRDKIEYLMSKVEEHDKPVIIFCRFLHEVDEIVRLIGRSHCFRIVGDDKRELPEATRKGGKHIVASYCISESVNLQYNYNTVFYYSVPTGFRNFYQSSRRVDRMGQKDKVVIYYLLGGWIDRRILALVREGKDALDHFNRYGEVA